MRARLWFVPLALAALLQAGAAVAEPIGPHWQFTPFGGFTLFDAKLRYPGSDLALQDNLHLGARLGYQTRSWLGLEGAVGFSPTTSDTQPALVQTSIPSCSPATSSVPSGLTRAENAEPRMPIVAVFVVTL